MWDKTMHECIWNILTRLQEMLDTPSIHNLHLQSSNRLSLFDSFKTSITIYFTNYYLPSPHVKVQ